MVDDVALERADRRKTRGDVGRDTVGAKSETRTFGNESPDGGGVVNATNTTRAIGADVVKLVLLVLVRLGPGTLIILIRGLGRGFDDTYKSSECQWYQNFKS